MAGLARPNIQSLGSEANYTFIGGVLNNTNQKGIGLFDGTAVNQWDTNKVAYFSGAGNYIEIDIQNDVNIWRSGTTTWSSYVGAFVIKKWNGLAYDNVTNLHAQTVTQITDTQWEKTIEKLPKGRYRFERGASSRLDSEWYLERITENKILISFPDGYKKWNSTWQTVTTTYPSELDFTNNGMDMYFIQTIPESSWRELNGQAIKILEYTEKLSQNESKVETEVEPFSIYDEFGDTMEILYYTDDTTINRVDLEITANYSPLDELTGDFEVVTWSNTIDEALQVSVPQLTPDVIADGTIYETPLNLENVVKVK